MYRRESGVSPAFAPRGGVGAREDAVRLSLSFPKDRAEPASSSSLSSAYATPTKLPRREPEPTCGLCWCGRSLRLVRSLDGVSYAALVPSFRVDAGDDERRAHDSFARPRAGEPRRAAVAVLLLPRAHASPRALALVLTPRELVEVRLDLAHHQRVHRRAAVRGLGLGLGIFAFAQRAQVPPLLVLRRGVAATWVPAERRVFLQLHAVELVVLVGRLAGGVVLVRAPGRARRGRAPPLSPRRLHPRRICTAGQRTRLAASPRRRGEHRSGARLRSARWRVSGDERVTLSPVRAAKRPAERRRATRSARRGIIKSARIHPIRDREPTRESLPPPPPHRFHTTCCAQRTSGRGHLHRSRASRDRPR